MINLKTNGWWSTCGHKTDIFTYFTYFLFYSCLLFYYFNYDIFTYYILLILVIAADNVRPCKT